MDGASADAGGSAALALFLVRLLGPRATQGAPRPPRPAQTSPAGVGLAWAEGRVGLPGCTDGGGPRLEVREEFLTKEDWSPDL